MSYVLLVVTIIGIYITHSASKRSELAVAEWMREIRQWSDRVLVIITKALYAYKKSDNIEKEDADFLVEKISTLLEVGRLYFPNQKREEHGTHKPEAYRGYRHSVLDSLAATIKVIEGYDLEGLKKSDIIYEIRRNFISDIFHILRTDSYNKKLTAIIQGNNNDDRDKNNGKHKGDIYLLNKITLNAQERAQTKENKASTGHNHEEQK